MQRSPFVLVALFMTMHTSEPLPADTDVLLIGAGIMSATLGTLLQSLAPQLKITVVDTLS